MSRDLERARELLPAYEVGEEIGRGGFGLVLEGRHKQLRREVAIKQLPNAFAADPEVRSRFAAEARLLASLDHPHIVPAHDFVERDGVCLLVMEKLSGGSLWDRFVKAGLSPETSCAAGLAAASGLHYAHERGILHRDVKPQNLLVSDQGVMKVADFGIAKVLDGGMTMATRAGAVLGTPAYMAPEQALGETLEPATDVYALGVTIYHFLAGRLPFGVESELASPAVVLYQRVHDQPISLRETAPQIPLPLVEAVMRSLASRPEDRYATAEEFGVALARAAGESFGADWLSRSDINLMVGGPITAAAERGTGPPMPPRMKVVPTGTVPPPQTPPPKEELVEIKELVPDEVLNARAALPRPPMRSRPAAPPEKDSVPAEIKKMQGHALAEAELLQRHRAGEIRFRADEVDDVERLLGGVGYTPAARLGLPEGTSSEALKEAALAAIEHWRQRAEGPLTPLSVSEAAWIVIRSCEGILAQLERD